MITVAESAGGTAVQPRAWSLWWRELTPLRRWSPLLLVAAYWVVIGLAGGFRADHLAAGLLVLALVYAGPSTQPALRLLLPLVLTGVVYDARRFLPDELRGSVRVAGPYLLEKRLFGIRTPGGVLTPNEWWQPRTHPALDLLTGACYITFIPSVLLAAAYFTLRVARTGSRTRSAEYVRARAARLMWSLLWLNLLGYAWATAVPAAPPWYVARHGIGPALAWVRPDAAGCARFDALVGLPVFAEFYGRSVDPFGAIPSLHAAYPMLAVFFAFRFGAGRVATLGVFLLTCLSAVYLNHHYVLDLVAGAALALLVGAASETLARAPAAGAPPRQSAAG